MNGLYWRDKTIVVSGGTGFIGSHFIEELALLGANVICLYHKRLEEPLEYKNNDNITYIQIDLTDYRELDTVCETISSKIDAFIHCAALDGNTQFKLNHAAEILDINNRLVSNVLKVCRAKQISNVVLLSSAEVYQPNILNQITEEDDFRKYLSFTDNGYILSKLFSEILAELYRKQYKMCIYTPRPTNVYGPRDSFDVATNRVIPAMIRKVSSGETIDIWGDGKQTRSFIYVKDLVYTVLSGIEQNISGPMNIATKDQVSILELAKYISKEYGAESLIHLDKDKPVGVKTRSLDVSKMYNTIDFDPLPIQDGLKRTITWYNESKKRSVS